MMIAENPVALALSITYRVPKIIGGKFYTQFLKRAVDFLATLITAPFWMLLIGVLAIIIKLDDWRAPVFYVQLRTGKNGRLFRFYKFRTMVPNAAELKKELMHLNELEWPDFKITNDPRITKIGKFLRKTSMDELPQLWNVMRGDMALVGPRPTSFACCRETSIGHSPFRKHLIECLSGYMIPKDSWTED